MILRWKRTWHLSATLTTRRCTATGDSYTYLCCKHSVRMYLHSERASAVSPEIEIPCVKAKHQINETNIERLREVSSVRTT